MLGKTALRHAPLPISARRTRHVDARLIAATEVIPHRDNDRVCHTRKHGANAVPVEIALGRVLRALIAQHAETHRLVLIAYPTHERLVVVCSRVGDTVSLIAVRQIKILIVGVIGKFQHLHGREAALLHHLNDALCHETQVLGYDGQGLTELLCDCLEERDTGTRFPTSFLGRLTRRNRKVLVEAAEVIHANTVVNREAVLHAPRPPGIAASLVIVPVIERISPELSVRREIIRRTTRHRFRLAFFIELKELGMRPGIRRVRGHINREISDYRNAVG